MKKVKQDGFIALFLILSISITLIFYTYLSSERVFNYIDVKKDFYKNRSYVQNLSICADVFMNNLIKSDFNIDFINNSYSFDRNFDFQDDYICHISDIKYFYEGINIHEVDFKIDHRLFKYQFKNGFLDFKKPWELI